jgi:ABC-type microcin C transport system duplicated ATPase subunit YejF
LLQVADAEMDRIRGEQISLVFQNAQSSLNPVLSVGRQIANIFRLHEGGSKQQAWGIAVDWPRFSIKFQTGHKKQLRIWLAVFGNNRLFIVPP